MKITDHNWFLPCKDEAQYNKALAKGKAMGMKIGATAAWSQGALGMWCNIEQNALHWAGGTHGLIPITYKQYHKMLWDWKQEQKPQQAESPMSILERRLEEIRSKQSRKLTDTDWFVNAQTEGIKKELVKESTALNIAWGPTSAVDSCLSIGYRVTFDNYLGSTDNGDQELSNRIEISIPEFLQLCREHHEASKPKKVVLSLNGGFAELSVDRKTLLLTSGTQSIGMPRKEFDKIVRWANHNGFTC